MTLALEEILPPIRKSLPSFWLEPKEEDWAGGPLPDLLHEWLACENRDMVHPFLMISQGTAVGFFGLSEGTALPPWAPRDAATLHGFRIDRHFRGKGYARQAVELSIAWIRKNRKELKYLMLAVNELNEQARRTYLSIGFRDTALRHTGRLGPQHILKLCCYR